MTTWILTMAVALSAPVKEVTVYDGRARVVREAAVEVPAGTETYRFDLGGVRPEPGSVRVNGFGGAEVLDVRLKTENATEIADEEWKALYAKLEAAEERRREAKDRIDGLRDVLGVLERIGKCETTPPGKDAAGRPALDPPAWGEFLGFYAQRKAAYAAELREAEKALGEIEEELKKLRRDVASAGAKRRRERRIVEVELRSDSAEKGRLRLAYVVRGPAWKPVCDLRVDTSAGRMTIGYFAEVAQRTGEDWENVELALSTADPSLDGEAPVLDPWFLGVRKEVVFECPAPVAKEKTLALRDGMQLRKLEAASAPPPEMKRRRTTVRSGATAMEFVVEGASSIASDGASHRTFVARFERPIALRCRAVPELDEHAYLTATVTNASEYVLLEGGAAVFLDDAFVGRTTLKTVLPNESFDVSLGVDEGVSIDRELLEKLDSSEGFAGRISRKTFAYRIVAKNRHDFPVRLEVTERLPKPLDERIKVKLLKPAISGRSDSLWIDEGNRVHWVRRLAPGETWRIPFSFRVDAPKDLSLDW